MYVGGNPYVRITITRLGVCNIILTCIIYYNLCLLVSVTCRRDTQTILHCQFKGGWVGGGGGGGRLNAPMSFQNQATNIIYIQWLQHNIHTYIIVMILYTYISHRWNHERSNEPQWG